MTTKYKVLKRSTAPNQKTVALACGVSRSTVAAILSGGALAERYNKETRKKVLATVEKLNYRPNRSAQMMRKQKSNLIAIVHFGVGIEAVHKTNLILSQKVRAVGYDYLSIDMSWYEGSVERTLTELIQARVEGVLISHIQEVFADQQIEVLHHAGIPVVSINDERRSGVPLICDDVADAFARLTQDLLAKDHRLILNLAPRAAHPANTYSRSASERVAGFRRAIEAKGSWQEVIEEDFFKLWPTLGRETVHGVTVYHKKGEYEQMNRPVYRFCQRLFRTEKLPDAMVCSNDALALEAILSGQEQNIAVPRDLAITGYDNDQIGAFPVIGLTTAEQDTEKICTRGVEALLNLIRDPSKKADGGKFPSQLIFRTSSGRVSSRIE